MPNFLTLLLLTLPLRLPTRQEISYDSSLWYYQTTLTKNAAENDRQYLTKTWRRVVVQDTVFCWRSTYLLNFLWKTFFSRSLRRYFLPFRHLNLFQLPTWGSRRPYVLRLRPKLQLCCIIISQMLMLRSVGRDDDCERWLTSKGTEAEVAW